MNTETMEETEKSFSNLIPPIKAVVGAGVSGIAAAGLLYRSGNSIRLLEKKEKSELERLKKEFPKDRFEILFGNHKEEDFEEVEEIIISPGIASEKLPLPKHIPWISEVELASRHCRAPIVSVTGTNGKTTVSSLIHFLLEQAEITSVLKGNIGDPFSDGVEKLQDEIVILEVSSFQMEGIDSFHPETGIFLNFAPDHRDRYPSVEAYFRAKEQMARNMTKNDTLILNGKDPRCMEIAKGFEGKSLIFSVPSDKGIWVEDKTWKIKMGRKTETFPLPRRKDIPLENLEAALLTAIHYGIKPEDAVAEIKNFKSLSNRMEIIGSKNGMTFINDSKATNIHAVLSALQTLKGKIHLIMGGRDKNEDLSPLISSINSKILSITVIGEAAERFKSELKEGYSIEKTKSLREAIENIIKKNQEGTKSSILLSPGCSSYDAYANYEARGEDFRKTALKFLKGASS